MAFGRKYRLVVGLPLSLGSDYNKKLNDTKSNAYVLTEHHVEFEIGGVLLEIISRKEAKELNLTLYYTGKPCKYGHISERYTSNCYCVTCCKNYQEENKDILKQYNKKYRRENKDSLRDKKKQYVENNKLLLQDRIKERNKNPEYKERMADKYKKYKEKNSERLKEKNRERNTKYRQKNKDKINARVRDWNKNRPEDSKNRKKEYGKTWARNNQGKINGYNHTRRARLLARQPVWFSEFDEFVITEAVELCKLRLACSGIFWEVDHLFPLVGKQISGLHLGINLQVIPMTLNRQKSNNMLYTEIAEYVRDL